MSNGSKDKGSFLTPILIALIGLVGTLGAALISNWDKVFSAGGGMQPKEPTDPSKASSSSDLTRDVSESAVMKAAGNIDLQPSSDSRIDISYVCERIDGTFKTIARTTLGNVEIINWNRVISKDWTPEVRCEEVSRRFQVYHESGELDYLTTGRINGESVICVAGQNGDCKRRLERQGLLFTVTSGESPDSVLVTLMGIARDGKELTINETFGERVYVNISSFIIEQISKHQESVGLDSDRTKSLEGERPCLFGCN